LRAVGFDTGFIPSPVSREAARRPRIGITVVLAAIAAALALGAMLHHRPSHASDAGAQPHASADAAPAATALVDVSLPAASEVFAHRTLATEDDCPTF